jgi:hypothetical protein
MTIDDLRTGRVKLIFGDPDQIRVEAERARQEEEIAKAEGDERAGDHRVLKAYTFLIEGTYSFEKTIRAYNQEDAEEELSSFGPDITDDVEYDCDHRELIKTSVLDDGIEKEARL